MTRRIRGIPVAAFLGAVLVATTSASANSSGITGQTCAGSNCHFTVALPTTSLCIEGLPSDGTYDPGTTYDIRVLVKGIVLQEGGTNLAGFSLAASGGTFTAVDGTTQTRANDTVATHTSVGNDQTEWDLRWTPDATKPSTTFTLAGNAVNGNGVNDSGDWWNSESFDFTASTTAGAPPGKACTDPELPMPIYVPLPAPLPVH